MTIVSGMSIQECLRRVHDTLREQPLYYGHGTGNAWDEACWLVDAVLARVPHQSAAPPVPESDPAEVDRKSAIRVAPSGATEPTAPATGVLSTTQAHMLATLLEQRITLKKPLAYLLHEAWFAGLPFYVDERVLVPRSPIAELIGNRFEPLLARPPARILDLCAGSGCLGIACAAAFPEAHVDLTDISKEALAVAAINVEKHAMAERVSLIESDLFAAIGSRYDLIVTNPPYVSTGEYASLPAEYHAEPHLGLLSGKDGLDHALRIIHQASRHLTENGILILEVGNSQPALEQRLPQVPFLWLDFEFGGQGVCALDRKSLEKANSDG